MTVTFARAANTYGSSAFDAATPTGSGGVIVVVAAGRDGAPTPATSGDWTSLAVSATGQEADIFGAWWTDLASPDMTWTPSGNGAIGLYAFRIADAASSPSVRAAIVPVNSVTTTDLPDVTTAPDGDVVGLITHQGDNTTSSTSLGFTEVYEGDLADEGGWWAHTCTALVLEGVTPGGGTFDAGTVTLAGNADVFKAVLIVVETGGGPPPPDDPPPQPLWSYRSAIIRR